jgi:hypothetical protein
MEKRWIRSGLGLLSLLALAGCAAPTPYAAATDDGFGYSETRLEANRYRVTFAGNFDTPRETVQNYLLYRAAELTVDNEGDYFVIADQSLERSTRYIGTASPGFGGGFGYRDGPFIGTGLSTVDARPIDEYAAFADILIEQGEKPPGAANAYDARQILARLGPTVVRPEGS